MRYFLAGRSQLVVLWLAEWLVVELVESGLLGSFGKELDSDSNPRWTCNGWRRRSCALSFPKQH